MSIFYDTFTYLCDKNNVKPTTVAKQCGGNGNSANSWKKGASPNSSIVVEIANYFGVSTDYLLLGKSASLTPEEQQLVTNFSALNHDNKIRVLERIETLLESQVADSRPKIKTVFIKHSSDKVSAGFGFDFEDYAEWDDIEVPLTPESRKADFCLTVKGDSMEPRFSDGDIVLVREQPAVDIGQICIFTIEKKGYIKKFGGDRLISLNDEYDDMLFSDYSPDDIRCNGLVIGRV